MTSPSPAGGIDLPTLAAALGYPLRPQGKSLGGPSCPCCGTGGDRSNRLSAFVARDGRWRWRCFACGEGGDGVDFLAKAEGITLASAMRRAREFSRMAPGSAAAAKAPAGPDAPAGDPIRAQALRSFVRIVRTANAANPRASAYLRSRGISAAAIAEARASGMLRFLPGSSPQETAAWLKGHVGESLLLQSQLVKAEGRWPALAFRPLIFTLPGGESFEARGVDPLGPGATDHPKAIRYGELALPWWRPSKSPEPATIIVVEGAMDLLALATKGVDASTAIMGLPGASSWRPEWVARIKAKWPGVQLLLGLDNDKPGDAAAEAIAEVANAVGLTATRVRPRKKDWCESL